MKDEHNPALEASGRIVKAIGFSLALTCLAAMGVRGNGPVEAATYRVEVGVGGTVAELRASGTEAGLGLRGRFLSPQGSPRGLIARVTPTGEPSWVVTHPDNAETWIDAGDRLLVAYVDRRTGRDAYRFGLYPSGDVVRPLLQKSIEADPMTLVLPIPGSSDLLLFRSSGRDTRAARIAQAGTVRWSKRYGEPNSASEPMMPFLGLDGGILWVGGGQAEGQGRLLAKANADGRVAWSRLLPTGSAASLSFAPTSDGGWIGHALDPVSGTLLVRLTSSGQVKWARKYPEVVASGVEEGLDTGSLLMRVWNSGAGSTVPAHGAVLIRSSDGEVQRGWRLGFQAYAVVAESLGGGVLFYGLDQVQRPFVAVQDSVSRSWRVMVAESDGTEQVHVASVGPQGYLSRFRYGGTECSVLPLLADYSGTTCSLFPRVEAVISDHAPRSEVVVMSVAEGSLRIEDDVDLQLIDEPLDVRRDEVVLRRTPGCPGQVQANRPPQVGDDGAILARNQTLRLPMATLLENDVDPDGDAISLVSVGAGSRGGTARLDGRDIVYTPMRDWSGYEEVPFEVVDARGDRAGGKLWIAVVPDRVPVVGRMQTSRSAGQIHVHFRGTPGSTYTLQGSEDLQSWTDIETVIPAPHGYLSWTLRDSRPEKAVFRVLFR